MKYSFKTSNKSKFIGALITILLPFYVFSQEPVFDIPMQQTDPYHITQWTTDEGLPQNSVTGIVQSKDGYIWVSTFGGLARFDGIKFDVYDISNSPGLGSNRLLRIFEDSQGILWIIHEEGGITHYKEGTFTPFTLSSQYPGVKVSYIIEDAIGQIWIGSDLGLFKYSNSSFKRFSTEDGLIQNQITGLFNYQDGSILVATGVFGKTSTELSIMKNDTIHQIKKFSFEESVNSYNYDNDSTLLLGFNNKIIAHKNSKFNEIIFPEDAGLIYGLIQDNNKNLWVSAGNSLFHVTTDFLGTSDFYQFQNLTTGIRALMEDKEGNIWVGTNGEGLSLIRKQPVTRYFMPANIQSKGFVSVESDGADGIWIGSDCAGLFHFDDGKFTQVLDSLCVGALYLDTKNRLWVGANAIVGLVENGVYSEFSRPLAAEFGNRISTIFVDESGVVWVGTLNHGLLSIHEGKITKYTTEQGLTSNRITSFTKLSTGEMLLGTDKGISIFSNRSFKSITEVDGLSPGAIRSIYEDPQGIVWAGSYGGGLSRIENQKITRYTKETGLSENIVSRIAEDDSGNLWILGNLGLFKVSKQQLSDYANGKISWISSISFGNDEGMAEGNGGGNVTTTTDGKTWWPTIDGIARIDINAFDPGILAPEVLISSTKVLNKKLNYSGQPVFLNSKERDIDIEYTGLSYSAPDKIIFSYKMEGYDNDWVNAGSRRIATYTNLPPGEYEFKVKAANKYNIWNDAGTSLIVIVQPALWQTLEAKIGLILLIIIGIYLAFHWRTSYLRMKKKELESEVKLRTEDLKSANTQLQYSNEELEDKKDELENTLQDLKLTQKQLIQSEKMAFLGLLSAGIGHEINNPLNYIKGGIDGLYNHLADANNNQSEEVKPYIDVINEGVDRTAKIVTSLNQFSRQGSNMTEDCKVEEIIDNCLVILQFRMKEGVQIVREFSSGSIIVKGNEGKLHQVFLNLLANAEQAISEQGKITIKTTKEKDTIVVEISDTGAGIDDEIISKIWDPFFTTKPPAGGTGLGLSITLSIIEEHNGEISVKSEAGKGSTFAVTLPSNFSE